MLLRHPFIGEEAVLVLTAPFGGGHRDSAFRVVQPHSGLDFVAMLATWPAGPQKGQGAFLGQGTQVGGPDVGHGAILRGSKLKGKTIFHRPTSLEVAFHKEVANGKLLQLRG